MPRYYFDVRDGSFTQDDVGLEFESIEAAQGEALRALAELAKEVLLKHPEHEIAIEVSDEGKQPLLRTALRLEIQRLQ
jgi:hypothetical protein